MFKRKRYIIWNSYTGLYAGEKPQHCSWVSRREDAKRFKRRDVAELVAFTLTVATLDECKVIEV